MPDINDVYQGLHPFDWRTAGDVNMEIVLTTGKSISYETLIGSIKKIENSGHAEHKRERDSRMTDEDGVSKMMAIWYRLNGEGAQYRLDNIRDTEEGLEGHLQPERV